MVNLRSKTIPQLRGQPFIGVLRTFRKDPLAFLQQNSELGDFIGFRLVNLPFIFLNDAEAIAQVFVKNGNNYIRGRAFEILKDLLGEGLATSEGQPWLRQRRMMQPAFHKESIASYAEIMVAHSERLMNSWQDGETKVLQEEMRQLTLSIATRCLFGLELNEAAEKVGLSVELCAPQLERLIANPLIPAWWVSSMQKDYLQGKATLEEITKQLIQEKRKAKQQDNDLLSVLIALQDDEGKGMTDKQLLDEVLTLLLAGHETTAFTLTCALYLLAKHSEIKAKLLAEIDTVLNGESVTLANLGKLTYTEKVIKETLRLYPAVAVFSRITKNNDTIKGFTIPKKTTILLSPYVTQRSEQYYKEPDVFQPDRWTPEFADSLPRFAYFPFGGGKHICIGREFALLEAKIVLVTLLQHYQIKLLKNSPLKVKVNVTLRPTEDIPVELFKR